MDDAVKLPILGIVRCKGLRKLEGEISTATIRKTPSGKYFVSILYKVEAEDAASDDGIIGIAVGIKEFAVDSNKNHYYEKPKYTEKFVEKLRREQRRLSRMKQGSKNREKQRIIV